MQLKKEKREVSSMGFLKKQSIGFYLTIITTICAILGLIFYMVNCNTSYFSNLGVNTGLLICAVLAILLEMAMIILSQAMGGKPYIDIIPVLCGVLLMSAFVIFISIRVNSIATILSFERNDQTMSDLSSAIIGMGFCFAAVLFNIIASFFSVVKENKSITIESN